MDAAGRGGQDRAGLVDGLADVYEGRLQQADKLYLAGISQALRSIAVIIAFSVLLFITRSIALAGAGAGLASVATLILVTIPLALLETEASRRMSTLEIGGLFRHCLPLFSALFRMAWASSSPLPKAVAKAAQMFWSAPPSAGIGRTCLGSAMVAAA